VLAHFGDDGTKELFRGLLEEALQDLIDAELTAKIGASRHERTDERSNYRNGARERTLSSPSGDLELRIPKLRAGSFFPSLLEPRRRVDKALWAVIMTAYITGTSTRKVDDLVKALGCDTGVSKSTVSRICEEIDEQVAVFRTRPLDHQTFPYVYLDATYVKARVDHHIVTRAVVIATGVAADGNREVLGLDVGDSEDEVFWTGFLRSLKDRGLDGVKLVISDAHPGLKNAIEKVFQGSAWQRCKVHLLRNLMTHIPKSHKQMVPSPRRRHQSRRTQAIISGPLSILMNFGAPRSATRRSRTATILSAVMDRSTSVARASRVCSSTMFNSFKRLRSAVSSNSKSSPHT
jgi:putative transposase